MKKASKLSFNTWSRIVESGRTPPHGRHAILMTFHLNFLVQIAELSWGGLTFMFDLSFRLSR